MKTTFPLKHPFIVKTKLGNYHGRFSNEKCAARTAVDIRGSVDGPHASLDLTDCLQLINRLNEKTNQAAV